MYLRGLVHRGQQGIRRPTTEPTVNAIAEYMGITPGAIRWVMDKPRTHMSAERQRLFSRVIAEIENGLIVFEFVPRKGGKGGAAQKLARRADNPKPIQRYRVHFDKDGVRMTPAARSPVPSTMPSLDKLLAAPKRRD